MVDRYIIGYSSDLDSLGFHRHYKKRRNKTYWNHLKYFLLDFLNKISNSKMAAIAIIKITKNPKYFIKNYSTYHPTDIIKTFVNYFKKINSHLIIIKSKMAEIFFLNSIIKTDRNSHLYQINEN